jgi:carbon-monoxide dehydrogenase medium subunit
VWERYDTPASLGAALALLAEHGPAARVIAGGTDLLLEIERGVRTPRVLIDITRIPGLDRIRLEDGMIHLGPLVTHNQAVASPLLIERAFPLARACWEVGAPQIRNRGTIAGNLVTASPANDTVPALLALDAAVKLVSVRGERWLPLEQFILGVRRTALQPDELLADIAFPAMTPTQRGTFIKLGLRKSQAISVVNVAVIVDGGLSIADFGLGTAIRHSPSAIRSARLAFGSVAPTVVRTRPAENSLIGKMLDDDSIAEAARLAQAAVRPIGDIRSPAEYRSDMVAVLTERALRQLRDGAERADWPAQPPLLWGKNGASSRREAAEPACHSAGGDEPIHLTVNGTAYAVHGAHDKTLLRLLRDDLGLTGSKEGCGEGECGACTVFLDGQAVMACLVPAPAAYGSRVVTVEGLADGDRLHPVQQAFVDEAAVQCGYCTPGFIMTAAKLLEEHAHPSREQITRAISGNLCRCTGYANIVRAIERAAQGQPTP